jgi:hypothetical protein
MIRSNPTAIPLRAADVKLLQAELERRSHAQTEITIERAEAPKNKEADYDAVHDAKQDRLQKSTRERIGH